jgi:hypothetical protein
MKIPVANSSITTSDGKVVGVRREAYMLTKGLLANGEIRFQNGSVGISTARIIRELDDLDMHKRKCEVYSCGKQRFTNSYAENAGRFLFLLQNILTRPDSISIESIVLRKVLAKLVDIANDLKVGSSSDVGRINSAIVKLYK